MCSMPTWFYQPPSSRRSSRQMSLAEKTRQNRMATGNQYQKVGKVKGPNRNQYLGTLHFLLFKYCNRFFCPGIWIFTGIFDKGSKKVKLLDLCRENNFSKPEQMEEKGKKGGKQDWFSDQKVIFWEVVICPKSHTLVSMNLHPGSLRVRIWRISIPIGR